MTARMYAGWLEVPYEGSDLASVEIGVSRGSAPPANWMPAYLDYSSEGHRIAKIHAPDPTGHVATVWVRVNGAPSSAGKVVV